MGHSRNDCEPTLEPLKVSLVVRKLDLFQCRLRSNDWPISCVLDKAPHGVSFHSPIAKILGGTGGGK